MEEEANLSSKIEKKLQRNNHAHTVEQSLVNRIITWRAVLMWTFCLLCVLDRVHRVHRTVRSNNPQTVRGDPKRKNRMDYVGNGFATYVYVCSFRILYTHV